MSTAIVAAGPGGERGWKRAREKLELGEVAAIAWIYIDHEQRFGHSCADHGLWPAAPPCAYLLAVLQAPPIARKL